MKAKKLILGLAMVITMGLGVTAYAANTETATSSGYAHQRAGLARITGVRGYDYIKEVLKNKLGMTEDEITDGLNSGKTMYDLAKEKGMTEDEFKSALLEERNKAIDKAVEDGNITKAEGDSIKNTIESNLNNCTGIPGQRRVSNGIGYGSGKGHMSGTGSRGSANCYFNNNLE